MRRWQVVGVLLLGLCSMPAPAQDAVSLDENSEELLTGRERSAWQRPDLVMLLLSNMQGETIGEIGAGMGYFTSRLSTAVGADGKVFALEFDAKLSKDLETYVARLPNANSVVVQGSERDTGFPAGELDMVFTSNTWHHVGDRAALRKAVRRALKPNGRFVIIDWRGGEIGVAPPQDHRLASAEVIREMTAAGWTLSTEGRFLEHQYCLIFVPPGG